ncbi:MAG: GNAT family N-acetyltransferase [Bacteroidetes bacterium]|nr:GNAT family N-acetyltransferase [Bacteroidota bacterium]
MEIKIRRPTLEDASAIYQLFDITVKDTFRQEGIVEQFEEQTSTEIDALCSQLQLDLISNGQSNYFLIAINNNAIVGTITYGPAGSLITEHLDVDLSQTPEVKCVYVLPEYQNKGIATQLFKHILQALKNKNYTSYCLDSGYRQAQQYWAKKLGLPTDVLKNYWPNGNDHMIWLQKIEL